MMSFRGSLDRKKNGETNVAVVERLVFLAVLIKSGGLNRQMRRSKIKELNT